jgi:hypothetical protein
MSKGYLWFCQNTDTVDYVPLSAALAKTIKQHNRDSNICVITDEHSQFHSEYVDTVKVLRKDDSVNDQKKFANEYKAFELSPFTHTIKLEADMLWNSNTDWWWNYLCQHDLVFALDCLDYKENTVKDTTYRPYHAVNFLPNIYNGMTYFRKSTTAKKFFDTCRTITEHWSYVKEHILKKCFDEYPTTDVVYALAYRLMDPTSETLIDYPWFKFIHNKPAIHQMRYNYNPLNYYYPMQSDEAVYFGGKRLMAPLHYFYKNFLEVLNVRVF